MEWIAEKPQITGHFTEHLVDDADGREQKQYNRVLLKKLRHTARGKAITIAKEMAEIG